MAKKKTPTYSRAPARWYTELGRDRKNASPSERERIRLEQRFYLDRTVRELREFFTGFDARDGYDLRYIEKWPAQRVRHVQQYGGYLHHLQSSPHVRVAPKSSAQREVLRTFTRQNLPRQTRGYIVHVPDPATTKVKVTSTSVQVSRRVRQGVVHYTIFFFEEIVGYQPVTFEEIQEAIKDMLGMRTDENGNPVKEDEYDESYLEGEVDVPFDDLDPLLPPGYYTFYTLPNGSIGMPQPREKLLRHAHEYFIRYESTKKRAEAHEGFAEIVLGLQYQGTHAQAMADLHVREEQRRLKRKKQKLMRQARGQYVTKKRTSARKHK